MWFAGRTGIAWSSGLGQPVGQLPPLLHYVQCEHLPWSLSPTAASGRTGTGRGPPLGSCRGVSLGLQGCLGVEQPQAGIRLAVLLP